MTASNTPLNQTKNRTVLRVIRTEFDDVREFDDPEMLARASEGFCPFARHFAKGDDVGTTEPQPVYVLPDGSVECRYGADHDRLPTVMRYEWIQEAQS